MRSNRHFLMVVGVAALALSGLVFIQFGVLTSDVALKEEQIAYSIPAILSDVHDRWIHNETLHEEIDKVKGTLEFTLSDQTDPISGLESELMLELKRTMAHNYPTLDYSLDVFISADYGCLIHEHHNSHLPRKSDIMTAQNHLCMCGMGLQNTFDVGFSASNVEELAYSSAMTMMLLTLLLAGIVSGAFFYMIFTINRQKKLSELKNDFVNNLTHEFKTPIFSISLAANALKEKEVRENVERVHRYVDLIDHEGKRLKNQVDKILQMALIDSGNLTIEKKQVDLHQLITREVASFKLIVEERGGKIDMQLDASHFILMGDETHLRNIIYNLLDNAQKYSEGNPDILVTTMYSSSGLAVSIADNGVGMPEEVQKFVFDKFYRAPTGDIHNVKGFGLGLSYVKSIVEAHRGWISLKSSWQKGSEFTIYFPVS